MILDNEEKHYGSVLPIASPIVSPLCNEGASRNEEIRTMFQEATEGTDAFGLQTSLSGNSLINQISNVRHWLCQNWENN